MSTAIATFSASPSIDAGPLRLVYVPNPAQAPFPSGVFEVHHLGALVGSVSLVGTSPCEARIGYNIAERYRGRGFATLAVAAVLKTAPSRGLDTLLAQCRSNNVPSRRILERSGFALRSSAPFSTTDRDLTVQFMVYEWFAPSPQAPNPALSGFESCVL